MLLIETRSIGSCLGELPNNADFLIPDLLTKTSKIRDSYTYSGLGTPEPKASAICCLYDSLNPLAILSIQLTLF